MNLINQQLEKIKQEKRLGLMTHVVVGYPSLEDTRQLVLLMAAQGVDFVELQIPFSDPLGDGPTIRLANADALLAGVKVADAFRLAKELIAKVKIPILLMTYANIVYTYGLEKFCQSARTAGISGLIIPDYNPILEERECLEKFAHSNDLLFVKFVALNSSLQRLEKLAEQENGFVYCFSSYGVTGTRVELDIRLISHLKKIRNILKQPLAVGFGISQPAHIQNLKGRTDIVVVGSALLKEFNQGGISAVEFKLKELRSVL